MRCPRILCAAIGICLFSTLNAWAAKPEVSTDPVHADADFGIQGEYSGTVHGHNGDKVLAAQVIALGDHKFRAVGFVHGLPGTAADVTKTAEEPEATANNGEVIFKGKHATGTIKGGKMLVTDPDGKQIGELARVVRESPTLGAKPPAGAVVLFDGKSADAFTSDRDPKSPARTTPDGLLMQGAVSKQKFGPMHMHIEFRLPYMPTARGQARGNSGCYLQGRYEVQMLDSFGLSGAHDECGGVYKVSRPKVNMCLPPLSWQTYDIDFTPAKFDKDGKRTAKARLSVAHNGVPIQENVELPGPTAAAVNHAENNTPGPIYLQNHGNEVRYRNIWVVEK